MSRTVAEQLTIETSKAILKTVPKYLSPKPIVYLKKREESC